jgi:opacity protein-like surface antigen
MVTTADLTLWGLGVGGLSVRMNGRLGVDLGDDEVWPGSEPALQLVEGYAEYAHRLFTARAGRQLLVNRLGIVGFDGGRATTRIGRSGVSAEAYVGLGLARASALPVTSAALDPLDEFQPRSRQVLAGAALGYRTRLGDVRLDYQREVDRDSRSFVSERAALSLDASPIDRWSVTAGVDYDLVNSWFGNADATVRYTTPWITAVGGLRQYRPHFDLWTIWGAFSPVPYHAVNAGVWVRPVRSVELRARWERYTFAETETETPLVKVDDDGWRAGIGVTYTPAPAWRLDAGYREEFGPGASSSGLEGSVSWLPTRALSLTAYGSTLDRPLEFRFEEASVEVLGLDVDWRPGDRFSFGVGAAHFSEDRDRPDAAAFDWNQARLHARATLFFRSDADALPLPPALRGRRTGVR